MVFTIVVFMAEEGKAIAEIQVFRITKNVSNQGRLDCSQLPDVLAWHS
jgi:hypothetical protein